MPELQLIIEAQGCYRSRWKCYYFRQLYVVVVAISVLKPCMSNLDMHTKLVSGVRYPKASS